MLATTALADNETNRVELRIQNGEFGIEKSELRIESCLDLQYE